MTEFTVKGILGTEHSCSRYQNTCTQNHMCQARVLRSVSQTRAPLQEPESVIDSANRASGVPHDSICHFQRCSVNPGKLRTLFGDLMSDVAEPVDEVQGYIRNLKYFVGKELEECDTAIVQKLLGPGVEVVRCDDGRGANQVAFKVTHTGGGGGDSISQVFRPQEVLAQSTQLMDPGPFHCVCTAAPPGGSTRMMYQITEAARPLCLTNNDNILTIPESTAAYIAARPDKPAPAGGATDLLGDVGGNHLSFSLMHVDSDGIVMSKHLHSEEYGGEDFIRSITTGSKPAITDDAGRQVPVVTARRFAGVFFKKSWTDLELAIANSKRNRTRYVEVFGGSIRIDYAAYTDCLVKWTKRILEIVPKRMDVPVRRVLMTGMVGAKCVYLRDAVAKKLCRNLEPAAANPAQAVALGCYQVAQAHVAGRVLFMPTATKDVCMVLADASGKDSSHLVLIARNSPLPTVEEISTWERKGQTWFLAPGGRKGTTVALREGDHMRPSSLYDLGSVRAALLA